MRTVACYQRSKWSLSRTVVRCFARTVRTGWDIARWCCCIVIGLFGVLRLAHIDAESESLTVNLRRGSKTINLIEAQRAPLIQLEIIRLLSPFRRPRNPSHIAVGKSKDVPQIHVFGSTMRMSPLASIRQSYPILSSEAGPSIKGPCSYHLESGASKENGMERSKGFID
jgi:hypothetical protein